MWAVSGLIGLVMPRMPKNYFDLGLDIVNEMLHNVNVSERVTEGLSENKRGEKMKNGLANLKTKEEAKAYAEQFGYKNFKIVDDGFNGFGPFLVKLENGEYLTIDNQ